MHDLEFLIVGFNCFVSLASCSQSELTAQKEALDTDHCRALESLKKQVQYFLCVSIFYIFWVRVKSNQKFKKIMIIIHLLCAGFGARTAAWCCATAADTELQQWKGGTLHTAWTSATGIFVCVIWFYSQLSFGFFVLAAVSGI